MKWKWKVLPFWFSAGAFGVCRRGDVDFPTPPALLLNSPLPPCACLVFLHFSLSVSDLASFLLSLFHSDSPDGKLISTVWEQTYRQSQTAPDSTGASPHPPTHPSFLSLPPLSQLFSLCLHSLLQMEEASFIPPFCPLFLPGSLLSPLLLPGGCCWWRRCGQ